MFELIKWLRAQLDEDEQVAQLVKSETEGTWAWTYRNVHAVDTATGKTQPIATTDTGAQAVYFGLWNPDRVLAEVEAKRRILDWLVGIEDHLRKNQIYYLDIEPQLKTLAQPYAGRPGWREDWRIDV